MRRQEQSIPSTKRTGLARALSKLGVCSRAEAARLIRAGRVRVNGATRRDPESPVHMGKDRIDVNDQAIAAAERVYLMLNKPRGVVTTASDEKGRETVYDLLLSYPGRSWDQLGRTEAHPQRRGKPRPYENSLPWVAPVGRLDKASEGLLLMTNDSEWAARVSAPETHLDKTYHVQAGAIADGSLLEELKSGVRTKEGEVLCAKTAGVLRKGERNSWLEIVLDEGKNRQIRRMLKSLGIEVLRLVRVAIGPLALGDLAKGAVRALTAEEKAALDGAMRR